MTIYVGVFLDRESREQLLEAFPPKYKKVYADHVTLAYKPRAGRVFDFFPLRAKVWFEVCGEVSDEKAQAVPVRGLTTTTAALVSDNAYPHVTISTADGVAPAYSNHLLATEVDCVQVRFLSSKLHLSGVLDLFPRTTV